MENTKRTKWRLAAGGIAGPLYVIVGLVQAFTRPGFDITRHALSLLSNGDLGWIQVMNFIATGLLVIAGAIGMRQALEGQSWAASLVGVYGLSLIGAGIFKADPAMGFPAGTPEDAITMSTSGMLHFLVGGLGFLSLIVACFLFARCFASLKQKGWAAFSALTGLIFLGGFIGIASGSGDSKTILGFWVGLIFAWSWLTLVTRKLSIELQ